MAEFWPTPAAVAQLPAVACGMNAAQKIVVSNSLRTAPWGPAHILGGDVGEAFRALKAGDGPDTTILGSGELVRSLADKGLIDTLEIMIYPVAIGRGVTLLERIAEPLEFALADTRAFGSGTVLLTYEPRLAA